MLFCHSNCGQDNQMHCEIVLISIVPKLPKETPVITCYVRESIPIDDYVIVKPLSIEQKYIHYSYCYRKVYGELEACAYNRYTRPLSFIGFPRNLKSSNIWSIVAKDQSFFFFLHSLCIPLTTSKDFGQK